MKKLYLLIWVENDAICTKTYPTKEEANLNSMKLSEGTPRLVKEIRECQLFSSHQFPYCSDGTISLMD